VLVQTLLINS